MCNNETISHRVPSEKWERYTSEMPVYLDLNTTIIGDATVETNLGPKPDRCGLWNNILPKMFEMKTRKERTKFTNSNAMNGQVLFYPGNNADVDHNSC